VEKQFCAVTIFLNEDTAYIAFRGTDVTLVGWKEDFNMAFKSPVPSQEEAVRYVAEVAENFKGKLLLGGHSKGGNLAVYVYAKLNRQLKDRIIKVYSHDGPGFKENAIDTLELESSQKIVEKTVPQSSVIGMLLESQEQYSIVKSNRTGLLQHDPFSWVIEGDHFIFVERLTKNAKYMDKSLHNWPLVRLNPAGGGCHVSEIVLLVVPVPKSIPVAFVVITHTGPVAAACATTGTCTVTAAVTITGSLSFTDCGKLCIRLFPGQGSVSNCFIQPVFMNIIHCLLEFV